MDSTQHIVCSQGIVKVRPDWGYQQHVGWQGNPSALP